jgi:hypothetical protein
MKANIFVAALLLFIIGCTPQQSDQLTQQQKDQIKQEVKVVCDSLWAKWLRLEGESTIQYLWDSPEFVAFNPDGSRSDFQAFKKLLLDLSSSAAAFKLAPAREDFYVLAKDAVVYAWFGKSEIVMKSGDKATYDPDAETFVFSKVAGQWKIVYVQESATIATQKAGKK